MPPLPHSPLLNAYRSLTGRVMLTVEGALDRARETGTRPPGFSHTRQTWKPVPDLLEQIDASLETFGETIVFTLTRSELSDQGRQTQLNAATTKVNATVDAATSDVLDRSTRILDRLRKDAFPARPEGDVGAQEATLAGLKTDHRMVLDSVSGSGQQVSDAMVERLSRAIGDDNALDTWLLASSQWPADYLASRGLAHHASAWDAEVGQLLDRSPDMPGLSETRRLYRALSNPQNGLPVLRVLFTTTLRPLIRDLGDFRLSSTR